MKAWATKLARSTTGYLDRTHVTDKGPSTMDQSQASPPVADDAPKEMVKQPRKVSQPFGLRRNTKLRLSRTPDADEKLSLRIQRSLQLIMSGLEDVDALQGKKLEDLRKDIRSLLVLEDVEIPDEEVKKAERVLEYMIRPSIEDCLNLWFGKSEKTDQEIWTNFGADTLLASKGHYDHWALATDRPRMMIALVIMLDQFRRNMFREKPEMYECDERCVELVLRGLKADIAKGLTPKERVFLCLVLTHSERIADQRMCMQQWEQVMTTLSPDDPLNVFHEIFNRHVAVVQRFGRFPHRNKILGRTSTPAEEDFLNDSTFRFDLPLHRDEHGKFVFKGTVHKRRTVRMLDHEYTTYLPSEEEAKAAQGTALFSYEGPGKGFFSQSQEQLNKQGYIRIGDDVPNFACMTSNGFMPRFHDFVGDSWCVLFSHPADFTPVCTTEFGETAKLDAEWKKRNVKVIGLSVDSTTDHELWINDINTTQNTVVNFPIIADADRKVSMLFGMLDTTNFLGGKSTGKTMTVRSVFIISPAKRVELIISYPAFIGRNFNEILRVIDALQLSVKYKVATPVNWHPGDDTVVLPFISDEDAEKMFGDQGPVRKVTNYLRYVRDPSCRVLSS